VQAVYQELLIDLSTKHILQIHALEDNFSSHRSNALFAFATNL
jgi:hypothetical protein